MIHKERKINENDYCLNFLKMEEASALFSSQELKELLSMVEMDSHLDKIKGTDPIILTNSKF